MINVFSWQNSISLSCFILYSTTIFACYSRNLLTSNFCIPVPYIEKDIFFGCQFQKVLQVFPSTAFQTLLLTMMATPFILRDSCPQEQISWSSELYSPIPVLFISLIPKILMFTLAISSLTTSNLSQFMDLIFQVPMQCCSLQHQTLSLSSLTFTTGCCFYFGFVSSFFLVLFLLSSPVVFEHLPTWGVHLSVSHLISFSYCLWGSQGKNTDVVCHSLLQWTTFCQNFPP